MYQPFPDIDPGMFDREITFLGLSTADVSGYDEKSYSEVVTCDAHVVQKNVAEAILSGAETNTAVVEIIMWQEDFLALGTQGGGDTDFQYSTFEIILSRIAREYFRTLNGELMVDLLGNPMLSKEVESMERYEIIGESYFESHGQFIKIIAQRWR